MADTNTDVKVEAVTEASNKVSKIDAGYRPAPSAARCGRCEHYRAGRCGNVAGDIDEFNTCDLWRPAGDSKPQVFGVEQLEHYSRSPGSAFQSLVGELNRQIMESMGVPKEIYAGRFAPGANQLGLPFAGASKMAPGSGQLALPLPSGPHQWDESKHPRDHGKFSSGPGGASAPAPAAPPPAPKPTMMLIVLLA